MKILVLSLSAILYLGTFLGVNSSGDSDLSLGGLLYSSAEGSPNHVESRAEEKPSVWKSLFEKLPISGANTPRLRGSSSGSSRKGKQPVEEPIFDKLPSSGVDSVGHAEISTRHLSDTEMPSEEFLSVESARADMKCLYESLDNLTGRLKRWRRGEVNPKDIEFLESKIEKNIREIKELRPYLRKAFGWNMDQAKTKHQKVLEAIERVKRRLKNNEKASNRFGWRRISGDEYKKLCEEQEWLEKRLKGLMEAKARYEKIFDYWETPEMAEPGLIEQGTEYVL